MAAINQTGSYQVTPVITAGAYSAGDVIGGLITIPVQSTAGSGTIRRVTIADDDNEKAALTLYFFNGVPTAFADNAVFAPVIGDLQKLIGTLAVAGADYVTVNSNAYAIKEGLSIDYVTDVGAIYCYAVVTATPTYTAVGDLSFRFVFWKE